MQGIPVNMEPWSTQAAQKARACLVIRTGLNFLCPQRWHTVVGPGGESKKKIAHVNVLQLISKSCESCG